MVGALSLGCLRVRWNLVSGVDIEQVFDKVYCIERTFVAHMFPRTGVPCQAPS